MKEIFINIDETTSEGIFTRQDNNNAEVYKIYIISNKGKVNLNGKSVKMGYNFSGTNSGDILVLNITDGENGEITLPITNKLTRKDGVFHCQLAIYGDDGYLENSSKFTLTVEKNVFSKITEGIEDIKGLTYVENLLEEARRISETLKVSITTGSTLNDSLEENILDGNSLNNYLEDTINSAKEINTNLNTSLEQANTTMTEVTQKKEELENTIDEADTINSDLKETIEEAKVTRSEATSKNTELKETLKETLDVINNLDESQNLPKIRADLTEVQNGLKLNQALAYKGYSIEAENTLVGRTEKMVIKGLTLQNLLEYIPPFTLEHDDPNNYSSGALYTKIDSKLAFRVIPKIIGDSAKVALFTSVDGNFSSMGYFMKPYIDTTSRKDLQYISFNVKGRNNIDDKNFVGVVATIQDIMILNRNVANPPFNPPNYFTGIKSFGEEEKEGDKYKITIVSHNENNTEEERKNIFINEPLRGFDENVCDILYEDEGQVKVNRITPEYTFTGDENWQMIGKYEYNKKTLLFYTDYLDGIMKSDSKIMCNNFLYSLDPILNTEYSGIRTFVLDGKEYLGIRINWKNSLSYNDKNVEGFKKWLKANKTTIVYQALNPKIEIVENCIDIDLDTYSNKTYFRIENSLPGLLDFKVPSNIASIVQSNSKAINELYDLINKLLIPGLLDTKKNLALKTIKNNLK
ncbi:BppU family phage baseplate upper protein [Clostridium perfringens]|uniref:BppU family phage baseplate upper protein n=1 Tax=Clostridium perfringens TaxID=1502 RepID=UPI003B02BA66